MTTKTETLVDGARLSEDWHEAFGNKAATQWWRVFPTHFQKKIAKAQLSKALRFMWEEWLPAQASKERNLDRYQTILWLAFHLKQELEAAGMERPCDEKPTCATDWRAHKS